MGESIDPRAGTACSDAAEGHEPSREDPNHRISRYVKRANAEIRALNEAVRARPPFSPNAIRLARLELGRGRLSRMIGALDACRAVGGSPQKLDSLGGTLFLEAGDFETAANWLARILATNPRGFSEVFVQALEWALAGIAADSLDGVDPRHKRRYLRALEHLVQGRPDVAEPLFTELNDAQPHFVAAWLGRRGALQALGRAQDAADLDAEWAVRAPASASMIPSLSRRRVSPRGLVFDPRKPIRVAPAGQSLTEVVSAEALRSGGDAILTFEAGGEPYELEPVIPLAAASPPKTRFSYRSAPRYMAAVEGAALVGHGIVLNLDGDVPEEVVPTCSMEKALFRRLDDQLITDPAGFNNGLCQIRVFDEPALLMAGPTDGGFGDWMLNFPPRLALAAAAGLDCNLVLRRGAPSAWIDILAALGVDRRRIVWHDPRGVSIFPRLYAPSWPLPLRSQPMRDLFGVYRGATPAAEGRPSLLLYLSREGVSDRKLTNEAEIRAVFERRGFQPVRPETLDPPQARALFGRAAVIAGPYGSAFLNVVHAPRPVTAFVLMPPEAHGFLDEVALWLGGCGARFGYLFGEGPAGRQAQGPDPWSAPVGQVEAALDELLAVIGQT